MTTTTRNTQITFLSPLEVSVDGHASFTPTSKVGAKVASVNLTDGRIFKVGQTLILNKMPFKINTIDNETPLKCTLRVANRTKASMLVMPMLNGDKRLYMYDKLLLNCFIGENQDTLVLVYRFSAEAVFLKFESALKSFKNFIKCSDPNEYSVLFEFSIPKKYTQNFKYFLEGKYSKFDPEYKMKILKFHGLDVDSQISEILFKLESRKLALEKKLNVTLGEDVELLSIIDIEKETFKLEDYF